MFSIPWFQFQDIILNYIHVPVYPDVQFGSFLWVSAGPTCSALPVNAKELSGILMIIFP